MDDTTALAASATFFREHQTSRRGTIHPNSQHSKRGVASREQRAKLQEAREQETRVGWYDMEAKESEVFIDGWWRHDVPFHKSQRVPLAPGETAEARTARLEACARWLESARSLVESFTAVRKLFNRESRPRNHFHDRRRETRPNLDSLTNSLVSRLRDSIVDDGHTIDTDAVEFRGIHFDQWIVLFMKVSNHNRIRVRLGIR